MSRLARKKALPKNRVVALIDIGSSSAAAALVEVGGDKPIVLAHKRVAMPIDGSRGAAGLEARMLTAAREAVRQVSRGRHAGKATSVAVFLPSPWSALTLDRIRFARAAPFVADEALVRRLMNVRLQREEHPGAGEAFGYTLSGMRLNGYAADFFGETPIMEIELTLGSARASRSLLERLGALARELSSAPADFYSSILAAAQALSLVITDENDYLICDSEGETAELLLVRDAIPEAHASIPAGRAGIVRTVALHGGFDTREISSALTLMADPRSPMSLSASGAIAAGRRACAERLGAGAEALLAFAPKRAYPIGEEHETRWFREALEDSARLKAVLPHDFDIRRIGSAELSAQVGNHTRGADPQIMLEALFMTHAPTTQ